MNDKLIKTLNRKNCVIRIYENPELLAGFYGVVIDKESAREIYVTDMHFNETDALECAKENAI